MRALYTLFIYLYSAAIGTASLFSTKARKLIDGRRGWSGRLKGVFRDDERVCWIHCASLGEFEQGRPLIEMIRRETTGMKILLTFFSPSGYEVRKDFPLADYIMYLPADTPSNVNMFLNIVKPEKAIFIKYEFWYNYLAAIQKREIDLFLVSGIFRASQPFFKWYGRYFKNILAGFTHLFIQDKDSSALLSSVGIERFTICGDTRFDRVFEISRKTDTLPLIERFRSGRKVVIVGSSWPEEEKIISDYINRRDNNTRWIIAPHEIDAPHIERLISMFEVPVIRYSNASESIGEDAAVLIIDNFGILSSAYRYADIAVVGGGFGKGIHNILEAATWGIPVLFGPNHKKFREAAGLINAGGGITFTTSSEFGLFLDSLLYNEDELKERSRKSSLYVEENLGATQIIFDRLFRTP